MLGFKTYEIISILYNVCGVGKYYEEVAIRISILMFLLGALTEEGSSGKNIGALSLAASAELLRIAGFSFIIRRLL